MRISNYVPNYQPAAQTQRTGSGSSSFGEQLDIAARRSADQLEISAAGADWQDGYITGLSPYCQLMDSYDAWKAQQPSQDLPDSYGPTEENLAYLKEHYSGDLSWEERVDALETMVQMGVITRDQRNDAMGGGLTTFKPAERYVIPCVTVGSVPTFAFGSNWDESLKDYIASGFKTSDDLFAWLDAILEKENA